MVPPVPKVAAVTFTAVVVLHDSEPELRALLDSLERHLAEPPQLVVVDSGSSDGGAALARAHGAEVIELPDNPGLRRRQQRRRGRRAPRRGGPPQPGLPSWSTARSPRSPPSPARTRTRCTPRGCSTPTAASSARRTRCPARPAR